MTRRRFLASTAALAAVGCSTVDRVPAGSPRATMAAPEGFPAGIPVFQRAYGNWSREILVDDVWTCEPRTAEEVVTLANWAHARGYRLRAVGARHGWTPLTIANRSNTSRVVLVDTTPHLTEVAVDAAASPATVTAGAGATLERVLAALQQAGLGWASVPAPGVLTIAGALAVNAHGAALPARGERLPSGSTFGSLSNLVTSLTAVTWDRTTGRYTLRTFRRDQRQIKALLTHLGRTFVTSVTMQAGPDYRLRCQSSTDIPSTELFGRPGTTGRTFSSYVDAAGRVEAIWFPFTATPWLKVWTPTIEKPAGTRQVSGPYNYPFSDSLSLAASTALARTVLQKPARSPAFGQLQLSTVENGLDRDDARDLWGWSKDTLLYIRPTTLRMSEGGGAVITSRDKIQQVVNSFAEWYSSRLAAHRGRGSFPINGPAEIRCSGLDQLSDVQVPSAGGPTLSSLRPRPDHPEWDTAVWLNVLSIPGTTGMFGFYREMERWMARTFDGDIGVFRPEWSKGWAFTDDRPYADPDVIDASIPNTYRVGVPATDNWDTARSDLNELDPGRVFSNGFLDRLLP